jgi:hypothetical protein
VESAARRTVFFGRPVRTLAIPTVPFDLPVDP